MKQNRYVRVLALLLILVISAGTLSGCKKKIADKDGASLRYKFSEIEEQNLEGLFTLNEDGTFSPLPDSLPGYAGPAEETSLDRFVWYTDNGQSFTELIPTVTDETPIVIIYDSDKVMPEKNSWYLERYEPLGATIGAHIYLAPDKTMLLSEEEMLNGTSAKKEFTDTSNKSKDKEHALIEVSGSEVKLPIKNVEPNVKMLLGLTYGKKYTFKYLQGTKTKKISLIADAYAFQSKEIIPMQAPYKKTEKGYFVINMPSGLKRGFYYISDLGFFYYNNY